MNSDFLRELNNAIENAAESCADACKRAPDSYKYGFERGYLEALKDVKERFLEQKGGTDG